MVTMRVNSNPQINYKNATVEIYLCTGKGRKCAKLSIMVYIWFTLFGFLKLIYLIIKYLNFCWVYIKKCKTITNKISISPINYVSLK